MALTAQQQSDIQAQLDAIKQKALIDQSKVKTLSQAEISGLNVTPQTTYQQASQFLANPNPSPQTTTKSLTSDTSSPAFNADFQSLFDTLKKSVADQQSESKTILEKYAQREEAAKTATEASKKLISSDAETAIEEAKKLGQQELASNQEARRGFATNTAVYRQIQDSADKRIRTLEKNRDTLLLQADAQGAQRMDDLIAQEQQLVTQSRQQYLQNSLSLLNTGMTLASFETPAQKQARELQAEQQKPLTLSAGQTSFQFNPQTGKYEVVASGGEKSSDYNGVVGEYQFYADQEKAAGRTPLSFDAYQTRDANRKAIANGISDARKQSTFLSISTKAQGDQILNLAINGNTMITLADQIIADPGKATNQLASLYLLVKNLDPTSAVREGELNLANQTQSYLQRFSNSLARLSEGRVIDPQAASDLAKATKDIAKAWNSTAQRKLQTYQSQANVAQVGSEFKQYARDANFNFNQESVSGSGDPLGIR